MGAFVSIAGILPALGDAITVTPPDAAAIQTSGIWLPADQYQDQAPIDTDYTRWDAQRLMTIPLTTTLPTIPKGTLIRAVSEDGSGPFTWRVEKLFGPREADAATVILTRTADC